MANILLKRKVLELRKLGKSYGQIRKELGVSKSTLSVWLRKYPLNREQIRILKDENEDRIEKFRETMRLKRERRLQIYYKEMQKEVLPFSQKELFLAGVFLYWGEGGKTERGQVTISNTDPTVIKFSLHWMIHALKIPKEKIKIVLHLYQDMVIDSEIEYWSTALHIPKSQFAKPYIKKSRRIDIDEKGYGHGTCNLRVCDTVLKEKIIEAIKVVADYSDGYIQKL